MHQLILSKTYLRSGIRASRGFVSSGKQGVNKNTTTYYEGKRENITVYPDPSKGSIFLKYGIFQWFFKFGIHTSLDEVGEVEEMKKEPVFELTTVPVLGEIPITKHVTWSGKLKSLLKTTAFKLLSPYARYNSNADSLDQLSSDVKAAYPEIPEFFFFARKDHLTKEYLLYYLTNTGTDFIRFVDEEKDPNLFKIDFDDFMPSSATLKPGFQPISGSVIFNKEQVLSITLEKETKTPGDIDWEIYMMRIRSNLFSYNTAIPHSIICHGVLSSKLFMLVHMKLPKDSPLKPLLIPYCFKVEANLSRFLLSVLNEAGVITTASAYKGEQTIHSFLSSYPNYGYRTPKINVFKDSIVNEIGTRIWNAFEKMITEYIAATNIDAATLEIVREYLVDGLWSEMRSLSAIEVLTYYLYTVTVVHYTVGHSPRAVGTIDPRYVSTTTRVGNDFEVFTRTESAEDSLFRAGVITSIARKMPYLTKDFSFLCDPQSPAAAGAVAIKAFSREMEIIAEELSHRDKIPVENDEFFSEYMSPGRIVCSCGV